ncbi:hypothetical protein HGM15179_021437, partial [Zosterops borbonicus]
MIIPVFSTEDALVSELWAESQLWGDSGFGSTGPPQVHWTAVMTEEHSEKVLTLSIPGATPPEIHLPGILDTGVDITILSLSAWPPEWPFDPVEKSVVGLAEMVQCYNGHTLQKQFQLMPTEAHGIVNSCDDCHVLAAPLLAGVNPRGLWALELWQTDVTQVAEFGRFKDLLEQLEAKTIFKNGEIILEVKDQQYVELLSLMMITKEIEVANKEKNFSKIVDQGWDTWLRKRNPSKKKVARDITGVVGTGLGILNSIDSEDLIEILEKIKKNGQKTLVTVHHDVKEIHHVMERMKKDAEYRFAVQTLKPLLCRMHYENVVVAMEHKRGWDTLLSADSHKYAVDLPQLCCGSAGQ